MRILKRKPLEEGELLIKSPRWAPDSDEIAVQFRYPRRDGQPSRGSPEFAQSVAVAAVCFLAEWGQLTPSQRAALKARLRAMDEDDLAIAELVRE